MNSLAASNKNRGAITKDHTRLGLSTANRFVLYEFVQDAAHFKVRMAVSHFQADTDHIKYFFKSKFKRLALSTEIWSLTSEHF